MSKFKNTDLCEDRITHTINMPSSECVTLSMEGQGLQVCLSLNLISGACPGYGGRQRHRGHTNQPRAGVGWRRQGRGREKYLGVKRGKHPNFTLLSGTRD